MEINLVYIVGDAVVAVGIKSSRTLKRANPCFGALVKCFFEEASFELGLQE